MTKQTAAEWLAEKLTSLGWDYLTGWVDNKTYSLRYTEILTQAKGMEKEQIKDAYEQGFADACDDANEIMPTYAGSEQYYNENHGGKNE